MEILPQELQNKIFYYAAEHPCAKMIKAYQPPFMKYPTTGTCQICERHGRKLNLKIQAYSGDYVCISCDNSYPFSGEYCRLSFLVDNEVVNDSHHSYDSDDDYSDEDNNDDDE